MAEFVPVGRAPWPSSEERAGERGKTPSTRLSRPPAQAEYIRSIVMNFAAGNATAGGGKELSFHGGRARSGEDLREVVLIKTCQGTVWSGHGDA